MQDIRVLASYAGYCDELVTVDPRPTAHAFHLLSERSESANDSGAGMGAPLSEHGMTLLMTFPVGG